MSEKLVEMKGGAVKIAITEYRGKTNLDIRFFYSDGDDLKPSPKGVSIPTDKIPEFYKKLRFVLKGNDLLPVKPDKASKSSVALKKKKSVK